MTRRRPQSRLGVLTDDESATWRTRAAASLYLGGACLGLVSVLLAGPETDRLGLGLVLGLAGAVGVALLATGDRWPLWCFQVVPLIGTLQITALIYFRHGGSSDSYAFFYVWVGLWVFYFLSPRAAIAQVCLLAALHAALLAVEPAGSSPVERWLISTGTVAISGFFVTWLGAELRQRAAQMSLLLDASHELADASAPARARPIICEALLRFSGAAITALYEPDPTGSALLPSASAGRPLKRRPLAVRDGPSVTVACFTQGQPIFIAALEADPRIDRVMLEATQAASGLWEPVVRHGETVAVLVALWGTRLHRLPRTTAEMTSMLAAEAATTIDRADLMERLEEVARTDALTGLLNRRAWEEQLPTELDRARRTQRPVCVAMLDLDRFKAYNDGHGHPAGDRLLERFAAAWRGRLRTTDILARYGGEEFALALAGCELERATEVAEELCRITPGGQTCSIGVAEWNGHESPDELMQRADGALYAAKRAGRGRVVVAA